MAKRILPQRVKLKLKMAELDSQLQYYQRRIEKVLDSVLPEGKLNPQHLHKAMRYSVLDGGKRVRPLLVYAAGEALGVDCKVLDIPAAAIELIHVYSLIHDDLPSMDDDDLRRGKPTCHKAFDEATAILAGDALQALSSHLLAHSSTLDVSTKQRLKLIEILTHASGSRGMAGGQAIDLESTGRMLSRPELENMHIHKTGALIRSCVLMAIECSDHCSEEQRNQLDHFSKCVGLAFQVRDDILDIESDTETLGKTQGADVASNKATYPAILGMENARQKAIDLHTEAISQLDSFGESADKLRNIADFIINRIR